MTARESVEARLSRERDEMRRAIVLRRARADLDAFREAMSAMGRPSGPSPDYVFHACNLAASLGVLLDAFGYPDAPTTGG